MNWANVRGPSSLIRSRILEARSASGLGNPGSFVIGSHPLSSASKGGKVTPSWPTGRDGSRFALEYALGSCPDGPTRGTAGGDHRGGQTGSWSPRGVGTGRGRAADGAACGWEQLRLRCPRVP